MHGVVFEVVMIICPALLLLTAVQRFNLTDQHFMHGSVVIKAQGLKKGNPIADALIQKMGDVGISKADYEDVDGHEHFRDYEDVDGKFPVLHDVAAFSYDCVYAMTIATCIGEGNKPILGLPNVEFEGASGHVRFMEGSGTRDPKTAYMTASEFKFVGPTPEENVFSLKYEYSGGWRDLQGHSTFSKIELAGGVEFTNIVPVEIEEIRVHDSVEIVIFVLAAISIASSVLFAYWTFNYRKTQIVRRSQPEFLWIMCLGCILSSSVPIIISYDSSESCKAAWMVYAVGFSVSIGSLSAKTIRIWRMIDAAKSLRFMRLSFFDATPPLLFILVVDVVLAYIMIKEGNVYYAETDVDMDEYERVLKREFRCRSKGPFILAFFLVNIFILAVLACLCYMSRDISTEYHESKYISMSVASSLQIVGLGFLLIAISDNTPAVEYLMVSLMTLVTDASTLYFIFVPKVYQLHLNLSAAARSVEISSEEHTIASKERTTASNGSESSKTTVVPIE
jgi:hypothetical protein